ncbi:MAG: hypothetical protein E7255_15835 [Lachnospiraceae bacterium]|jgi:competence protein ComEA|nr:hypothetical protein [Lachnospiraceae bacterium]
MKKKIITAALTGAFLLIAGIGYSCAYKREDSDLLITSPLKEQEKITEEAEEPFVPLEVNEEDTKKASPESEKKEEEICVHICGAVVNPGVYTSEYGARIVDFIELAGGLTSDADGDYINQAETVSDGRRIYIPTKEEVISLSVEEYILGDSGEAEEAFGEGALLNINKASAQELMELPGIGQAKADRIIEYRKNQGKFQSIEDLMKIPGIKEGLFQQISSLITVN